MNLKIYNSATNRFQPLLYGLNTDIWSKPDTRLQSRPCLNAIECLIAIENTLTHAELTPHDIVWRLELFSVYCA